MPSPTCAFGILLTSFDFSWPDHFWKKPRRPCFHLFFFTISLLHFLSSLHFLSFLLTHHAQTQNSNNTRKRVKNYIEIDRKIPTTSSPFLEYFMLKKGGLRYINTPYPIPVMVKVVKKWSMVHLPTTSSQFLDYFMLKKGGLRWFVFGVI